MKAGDMIRSSERRSWVRLFSHPLNTETLGNRIETDRLLPDMFGFVVEISGADARIVCSGGTGWVFSRNLEVME